MPETNKAIYSRAWQELMNTRNLAIVDELFAPNYVRHDPHFSLRGREALKQFVTALHNDFSAIRFTIDDLLAEGTKVVKRFTLTCTHTGAFRGMPPSGKRLTLTGLTLSRIAHGQILEEWESTDWLGWQQQLGIIPETATDAPIALALLGPYLKRRGMMTDLTVTTTIGQETRIAEATVEQFKSSLHGDLLRPSNAEYDEMRKVFNGMIDKRPALIVRCAGTADVMHAVNFARTHNVLVAVRGGGHSVAGKSVCDGGMLIDLSSMKGVRVDHIRRVAYAQAGLRLGELDRETQAFGLATTLGTASDTGIAGLTLGGGIGWLNGKCGLACDNLLSVDVVTADGQCLTASASENADLFWGVRGGASNFGIVTSFEYRLHAVGPVLGGMVLYPIPQAREVLRFYDEFAHTCPDELSTLAAFLTAPDGNPVVAIVVCYCGSLAEGERVLTPLRTFGAPVADLIQPMPYVQMQSLFDEAWPSGRLHYWKSNFLRTVSNGARETIVEYAAAMPSPMSFVVLQQIHGAASRVAPTETAFAHRAEQYDFGIYAMWTDPANTEKNVNWARTCWEAMQPFVERGVYVNGLGEEGDERVRAAYGPNYDRLIALKNKYDPTNFFRLNQNIKPTV